MKSVSQCNGGIVLWGLGRAREPPDGGKIGPRRDLGMGELWSYQSILPDGNMALLRIKQML